MARFETQYGELFEYLSAPVLPGVAEAAVVCGRQDRLIAIALGDLVLPSLTDIAVITGGIGKDSGNLLEQGYRSESYYLFRQAQADASERGYTLPPVILDEKASNGGDNARNSLDLLHAVGPERTASLTVVAHATSLARLAATVEFEGGKKYGTPPMVHRKPSAHSFDPSSPTDRKEAVAEMLRLIEWPSKGLLGKGADLPEGLVDFALEQRDTA